MESLKLIEEIGFADRIFIDVITSIVPYKNITYMVKGSSKESINNNVYDFNKRWHNCTIIESYVDDDGSRILRLEDNIINEIEKIYKKNK
jgi:hypothetical protein